jgi:hypothetical protein
VYAARLPDAVECLAAARYSMTRRDDQPYRPPRRNEPKQLRTSRRNRLLEANAQRAVRLFMEHFECDPHVADGDPGRRPQGLAGPAGDPLHILGDLAQLYLGGVDHYYDDEEIAPFMGAYGKALVRKTLDGGFLTAWRCVLKSSGRKPPRLDLDQYREMEWPLAGPKDPIERQSNHGVPRQTRPRAGVQVGLRPNRRSGEASQPAQETHHAPGQRGRSGCRAPPQPKST